MPGLDPPLVERAREVFAAATTEGLGVTATDPLIGVDLAGYRILELIGRGGMGAVYLAESGFLGRRVAVKVMLPELAGNPEFRQRFIREAGSGLTHPNIVPILDAGESDGVLFIAMEYVDGKDLKAAIRRERKLPPPRTISILEQVAGALDHAHGQGVVHRDVKPQNILLGSGAARADQIFLTDFGLVKRITSESSFTTSAYLMGTLHYMAPEQIEGKPLDGRTDVYALACVVYECLTGSVPFDKESEVAVLWSHVNDEPPSAVAANPLLPDATDIVLSKAMAKAPQDRFLTAGEFADALSLQFGGSRGRARSVWGPGQVSASGKRSRPLQTELAARAAARAPAVPVAAARTKGFAIGVAATVAVLGMWLGFGDPERRAALGNLVDEVTQTAPFVGDDDAEASRTAAAREAEGLRASAGRGRERDPRLDDLPQGAVGGVERPEDGLEAKGSPGRLLVPPTTNVSPSEAGASHRVLFSFARRGNDTVGGAAIYTMNPDGSGIRLLFNSAGWDNTPVWSPDGKSIAFTSGYRIFVMNANGTGVRAITPSEGWARNPSWSPTGERLVFEYSVSADATYEVEEGWGIATVYVQGPGVIETLTPLTGSDHDPDWSPNGTQIAFTSYRNDPDGDIFVMSAGGADITPFAGGAGAQRQPAWSPSGRLIAYSAQRSRTSGFDIYVKGRASDAPTRVTHLRRAFAPTFSPTGGRLLFVGGYSSTVEREDEGLFYMSIRSEGGQPDRLGRAGRWSDVPDWR